MPRIGTDLLQSALGGGGSWETISHPHERERALWGGGVSSAVSGVVVRHRVCAFVRVYKRVVLVASTAPAG